MRRILVSLAVARVAAADPTTAQSDALFHQGRQLLEAGRIAEACAAFDASEKLQPDVATVLNQANCHEKNGQLATAWGLFFDAERQLRGIAGDDAAKRRQVALARVAALEPRLSSLAVVVTTPVAGLVVERDGSPIDPGIFGRALPIDGGAYSIVARAPGFRTWTSRVNVATADDHVKVEVPALEPVQEEEPEAEPSSAESGGTRSRVPVMPIVLSGGAVVLLGASVGLELWAESTAHRANELAMTDLAAGRTLWHDANTRRTMAGGFAAAGIACTGVAVWAWVAARRHASVHTAMVPMGLGLALAGDW